MRKQIIRLIIALVFLAGLVGLGVLEWKECKEKIEWQTYTSPDYGYSISYPGDWYLRKETADAELHLEENEVVIDNGLSANWPIIIKKHVLYIESTKKPLYIGTGVAPDNPNEVAYEGHSISIVAYENAESVSLEEYINSVFSGGEVMITPERFDKLETLEAHETDGWISYLPHYFLEHEGYIYEIRCKDSMSGRLVEIADEMISTFRFGK